MATKTLKVFFAINEDGDAQVPAGTGTGFELALLKPDGTVHTAWGNATQYRVGEGDVADWVGLFFRNFTINDASDVAGIYHAVYKADTTGGKSPLGTFPVTVDL